MGELDVIKSFGFVVVVLLFIRMCCYMTIHPRLAVLTNTMSNAADDAMHFLLYWIIISSVFAVLGTWAFSYEDEDFASVLDSWWALLKIFTTEIDYHDERNTNSLWVFYVITWVAVIFICLLNFLLAIVVHGYDICQQLVLENKVERNFIMDFNEFCYNLIVFPLRGWPLPLVMWNYLRLEGGCNPESHDTDINELPAVTAEELMM